MTMASQQPFFQHANPQGNRLVVYTAIYGNYDVLREPPAPLPGCDFVCFTDNPQLRSEHFDIVLSPAPSTDPSRQSRHFKILPHRLFPNHEYSLWLDASIDLKTDQLLKMADDLLRYHDIALFRHGSRDCIYDEMEACIAFGKDDEAIMQRQIEKYRQENFPAHLGLASSGVMFRRHNATACIRLCEAWWQEICAHSRRDQLSFIYACWKTKTPYGVIPGGVRQNEFFLVNDHQPELRPDTAAELQVRLDQQSEELKTLTARLAAIELSDGFRLLGNYYAWRDRLLPLGSWRRQLAKRVFRRFCAAPEN
jgi:hypothetical protein